MSHEMERQKVEGQSSYDVQVNALINRFSALVEHAQMLVFPSLRAGIAVLPDMTGWSRLRRIAFTLCYPIATVWSYHIHIGQISESGFPLLMFGGMLAYIAWVVALAGWYIFVELIFAMLFGRPQPFAPTAETSILGLVLGIAMLMVMVLMIFAAYWRWVEFFRDRRYPMRWRLVVTACYVAFAASITYWVMLPNYGVDSLALLTEHRGRLIWFVVAYLLFVLPMFTFALLVCALDSFLVLGSLCMALLHFWRAIHYPLPVDDIRKLAVEPIPAGGDGDPEWRLSGLKAAELEVLRRWAVANREGTDKRLLPTAIVFGVLAVFANTRAFSTLVDKALAWFSGLFALTPWILEGMLDRMGASVVLAVVFMIVGSFVVAFVFLFRNLATQSLIIEACIVAEYAREQLESPDSATETATAHKGFWRRLLGLFGRH